MFSDLQSFSGFTQVNVFPPSSATLNTSSPKASVSFCFSTSSTVYHVKPGLSSRYFKHGGLNFSLSKIQVNMQSISGVFEHTYSPSAILPVNLGNRSSGCFSGNFDKSCLHFSIECSTNGERIIGTRRSKYLSAE